MGSVGSLRRWFPLFNFCLLVSSVSDFCPDMGGQWWTLLYFIFLGSLVQLCCGEGGMLQTNNTGMCLQCLSHTGPAPAHSAHHSGSTLLCREPSEAGPRLHAPPRSKPLRLALRYPSEAQIWLGLRFVAFPGPSSSGVGERGRCDLSPFPAAHFSGCTAGAPCQADGACPEPQEVLVSNQACLQFGR